MGTNVVARREVLARIVDIETYFNQRRSRVDIVPADTITIVERQFQDMKSNGADVKCLVSLKGRISGTPPPVAALRSKLIDAGLSNDCVRIDNLSFNSSGAEAFGCIFVLGLAAVGLAVVNGSNMNVAIPSIAVAALVIWGGYWLAMRSTVCQFRVVCKDSAAVEAAHKLIAGNADFQVTETEWRYEIDSGLLTGWAEKCIERANVRAEKVAAKLGVKLDGVYSFEEQHALPKNLFSSDDNSFGAAGMARYSKGRSSVTPSADVFGSERAGSHVVVRYRFVKL